MPTSRAPRVRLVRPRVSAAGAPGAPFARAHIDLITGQAKGCPMRQPAYEPSPQVKPTVHSPFDINRV